MVELLGLPRRGRRITSNFRVARGRQAAADGGLSLVMRQQVTFFFVLPLLVRLKKEKKKKTAHREQPCADFSLPPNQLMVSITDHTAS